MILVEGGIGDCAGYRWRRPKEARGTIRSTASFSTSESGNACSDVRARMLGYRTERRFFAPPPSSARARRSQAFLALAQAGTGAVYPRIRIRSTEAV
jgi:hypothetical protein